MRDDPRDRTLRVLHLAYEDPRAPSSGGGALRTREVASRMSGVESRLVTFAYPGASRRRRNGFEWSHCGWGLPCKAIQVATYFASLPFRTLASRHDLVVEDFAPPWTYAFSPFYSRAPVIAVVQWFFASHMTRKYGLPFDRLERLGLRAYDDFIVMTSSMQSHIRKHAGNRNVCVAGCGVDDALFAGTPRDEGYVLFLGRLDRDQKGLDILLRCVARDGKLRLRVAGDGPDGPAVRELAANLGLGDRVEFVGRVAGKHKRDLLSGCRFLAMPSRYETFGLVGMEAMASAKPIVTFDLPCYRDWIEDGGARRIPCFDEEAFAHAMTDLWRDPDRCRRMGAAAREGVAGRTWDRVAAVQESYYRHVLGRRRRGASARSTARVPAVRWD